MHLKEALDFKQALGVVKPHFIKTNGKPPTVPEGGGNLKENDAI